MYIHTSTKEKRKYVHFFPPMKRHPQSSLSTSKEDEDLWKDWLYLVFLNATSGSGGPGKSSKNLKPHLICGAYDRPLWWKSLSCSFPSKGTPNLQDYLGTIPSQKNGKIRKLHGFIRINPQSCYAFTRLCLIKFFVMCTWCIGVFVNRAKAFPHQAHWVIGKKIHA